MRNFAERYRLPAWISILLVAGFLTTSIGAYLVSLNVARRSVADQALPLAGDGIAARIRSDFLRPTLIASMMADDSFVRDWLRNGESDPGQIQRYLEQIQQKYRVPAAFLAAQDSHRYYYAGRAPRLLDDDNPHDRWFQRARDSAAPFTTEIDSDLADAALPTVFINYRMQDEAGRFLGVTGIGLRLDAVRALLGRYQARYGCRVYFVDRSGKFVLSGKSGAASALPATAPQLLARLRQAHGQPLQTVAGSGDGALYLNGRYLPELGWYLLVEQDTGRSEQPARTVLALNLAISAAVTLLVLMLVLFALRRYRQRLEQMAGSDALTGLPNRQAFDILFHQSLLEAERTGRPLSAILFDIDFFKQVNDTHGHLAGDDVLRTVARIARETLRESDAVSRWGGEEFLVLLKECTLEQAASVAEKLRYAIDHHDFSAVAPECRITISLGVAQHALLEPATSFFARADDALYKAKANGRNRLQVARTVPGPAVPEALRRQPSKA